jgi:hypothetical protein
MVLVAEGLNCPPPIIRRALYARENYKRNLRDCLQDLTHLSSLVAGVITHSSHYAFCAPWHCARGNCPGFAARAEELPGALRRRRKSHWGGDGFSQIVAGGLNDRRFDQHGIEVCGARLKGRQRVQEDGREALSQVTQLVGRSLGQVEDPV